MSRQPAGRETRKASHGPRNDDNDDGPRLMHGRSARGTDVPLPRLQPARHRRRDDSEQISAGKTTMGNPALHVAPGTTLMDTAPVDYAYPDTVSRHDDLTEDILQSPDPEPIVGAVRAGMSGREDQLLTKPVFSAIVSHSANIAAQEDSSTANPTHASDETGSVLPSRNTRDSVEAPSPPVSHWNRRNLLVSAVVLVLIVVGAVVGAVVATGGDGGYETKTGPQSTPSEAPTVASSPTPTLSNEPTGTPMPTSPLNLLAWSQLGENINGEAPSDRSGFSMALSADGQSLAVGALLNEGENGLESGHVRVYRLVGGSWLQIGQDIDGESSLDLSGFSVSLSAGGTVVGIGAPDNADNPDGRERGQTRVFQFDNVTAMWTQVGQDINGVAMGTSRSGYSVSLSADGNTVAICDPENNFNTGHVLVYGLEIDQWVQIGSSIPGDAPSHRFCDTVSLSADGTVLAASSELTSGTEGVVRVFGLVDREWSQIGDDIEDMGSSLALSEMGTIVATTAFNSDVYGIDSGLVRVYGIDAGRWVQIGSDIPGESAGDFAGFSVALSAAGDVVAVGSSKHDGVNGVDSGQVRAFRLVEEAWVQLGSDLYGENAGDEYGSSVSLSGDGTRLAIGADLSDASGTNSGQVRVFQLVE